MEEGDKVASVYKEAGFKPGRYIELRPICSMYKIQVNFLTYAQI